MDVLPVGAGQRDVLAVDLAREQRHPLVLRAGPGQRRDLEGGEVVALDELRQDLEAVVGGVRGVVAARPVVLGQAHEPGVLHAPALVRPLGPQHALAEASRRVEGEQVVGRGQPPHRRGAVARQRRRLLVEDRDGLLQLGRAEVPRQAVHDPGGEPGVGAELDQLVGEVPSLVDGGPALAGLGQRPDRLDLHVAGVVDDPGAEGDGGDVPLGDRPQAQHEAARPVRHAGLVRRHHHRRVRQGRGLEGVLLGQVGPDQAAARLVLPGQQVVDALGVAAEQQRQVAVATGEPAVHVLELGLHLVVRQAQQALDDAGHALVVAGDVRSAHDADAVRPQVDVGAVDRRPGHPATLRGRERRAALRTSGAPGSSRSARPHAAHARRVPPMWCGRVDPRPDPARAPRLGSRRPSPNL